MMPRPGQQGLLPPPNGDHHYMMPRPGQQGLLPSPNGDHHSMMPRPGQQGLLSPPNGDHHSVMPRPGQQGLLSVASKRRSSLYDATTMALPVTFIGASRRRTSRYVSMTRAFTESLTDRWSSCCVLRPCDSRRTLLLPRPDRSHHAMLLLSPASIVPPNDNQPVPSNMKTSCLRHRAFIEALAKQTHLENRSLHGLSDIRKILWL